ncbi:hypothetical protein COMNV_01462 [Commensalibacter sp. Nvir]|uniref:hypothetical protein n=1 Tax=Commensalibacter sp. Nvir TaxID=3069817 RepID=UPI002D32E414|nr:hypothetical protein COMNV_01462 [Commensalibacter sp. Nvir]
MSKTNLLLAATLVSTSLVFGNNIYAMDNQASNRHPADVSNKPSAKIYMTFHSADVGVGFTWGDGVLKYHGRSYPFTIKGGNIVALGFSKSQATGNVYNLRNLYDFEGEYAAASGEATAGVGVGAANLKNSKNVTISIDTKTIGGRLAGAPGGFTISFKNSNEKDNAHWNKGSNGNTATGYTTKDLNEKQLEKIRK